MYSKAEMQQLKRDFWIAFAEAYPRKWILYDTKIKDFSFKFHADGKEQAVMLDIEHRDPEKRHAYFDKVVTLREILETEFLPELDYIRDHTLDTGKVISRIWVRQYGLSVGNREHWPPIFAFFAAKMSGFEAFFADYGDYISDI